VTLFREVERILRHDPILRNTVNEKNWQTWDGSERDFLAFARAQSPAIRLTPLYETERWFSPDSTQSPLIILITLEINTTNSDDVANLWQAIEWALYPRNPTGVDPSPRKQLEQRLRDSGAFTGVVTFLAPAYAPMDPEENTAGRMIATGKAKLDVLNELDP
jgi:hypothetical protein